MTIKWQSPGSDQAHEIPDIAEILFELNSGAKLGFRIAKLSDGTEYLERVHYGRDPEIMERRVNLPNRREAPKG